MRGISGVSVKWQIIGGLVAVGLLVQTVAPNLVAAALPLLLVAACPLMMLFMMKGMHGSQGGHCSSPPAETSQSAGQALTPGERLAELKAQLESVQARHEVIARELAELEGETSPTVREAEAIARAAVESARPVKKGENEVGS